MSGERTRARQARVERPRPPRAGAGRPPAPAARRPAAAPRALAVAALLALAVLPLAAAQGTPAGGAAPAANGASGAAAAASGGGVEISDRAYAIASQLRCPVCTAESVADSNAQISVEMRTLIQKQLDAGRSEAQIIAYFKQRYGDWILLDPPKRGVHLLVWLLPVLALLAGAAALGLFIRRWQAAAAATPQADPDALARVRRAIAAETGGGAGEGDEPEERG